MTTAACDLCTSPVADLAHICPACTRPLADDLADIPDLDHELDITVSRRARIGAGGGGGRGNEKPLPANLDADQHGRHLKQTLTSWARLISDQRGLPHPLDGLAPTARWMAGHIEWLRHHPAAGDAVTEIREAVHQVRRAIDRPLDRAYAGPCNECGTPLYGRPGAAEVACRGCTTPDGDTLVYGLTERRDWMLAAVLDKELPAADIARALTSLVRPIAPALLYTWVKRKKLQPVGSDDRGHALFRLGDVADLMDATAPTLG